MKLTKEIKISIIRTPFVFPLNHISSITAVPDIGTAYINGCLRSAGYNSRIIDAAGEAINDIYQIDNSELLIRGLPADEIILQIPRDVDMIGVQSMHSNRWIYDAHIIKLIIKHFPNVKIFVGGEHASACSEFILKEIPRIDACIIGEGEETVLELVNAFSKNECIENINGLAFINSDEVVCFTKRRERTMDLLNIPRPSWEGVPIEKYLGNLCGVNSKAKRSITMIATRGCPFSCTFCTAPGMWESTWYARTPEDVIDEIKSYIKLYKIEHIDFVDLTIAINPKWMENFCKLLIDEKLGITWAIPIGTRTESLNFKLLNLMKESGLTRVLYSAESGSEATLDRIKKELNIKHFNQVVKESSKLGIIVKVALIFGFPGQTMVEVLSSFWVINKLVFLGVNDIVCLSFVPYPKTELYDQLNVKYDYSSFDRNIRLNNDIPSMKSWSNSFGDKTLRFIIVFLTLYFYLLQGIVRPLRVVIGLYRVFVLRKPHTNIESIVFELFKFPNLKQREKVSIKSI